MSEKKNKRRQFLRNTSLASLALGLSPLTTKAETTDSKTEEELLACDKTTKDYYGQGPFYTKQPPFMKDGSLADANAEGQRLIISGRIYNLDCSAYIGGAEVDVWQADHHGAYDNEGFNLRGKTISNDKGFYMFETIKPGKYLNGNAYRPSHIHFKITAKGYPTLTTQLYFDGDTDIPADRAASITKGAYDARSRIIPLIENNAGILEGVWDITINGEGTAVGVNDLHLEKGIIYKIESNPIANEVNIRYGVFNESEVSLFVYDINGRKVATLEQRTLPKDQYDAVWNPDVNLPNGHYFVALKVNDLQVNYQKIAWVKK